MKETLYKKDKKGNVLQWKIQIQKISNSSSLMLVVTYGRFDGKQQLEETLVEEGKAKRTIEEQTELQFNSLIGKQKDKGYKSLKDLQYVPVAHEEGDYRHTTLQSTSPIFNTIEEFLKHNLPKDSTDAQGRPKPMKCTALQDTKTNGLKALAFKKITFPCCVQPKLDGVRCLLMFDRPLGKWIAISSSGKSYNVACRFILEALENAQFPKEYILDGELYIHGESLQYLSGLARKTTAVEEQKDLQFHAFDIVNNQFFQERFRELDDLMELYFPQSALIKCVETFYNVGNPNRNSEENKRRLQELTNTFIVAGYEGSIIRNSLGLYKQGIRSSEIFKWKNFQDDEYEITGIELGKRGSEDMVFVLKTPDGKEFKAKPLGNRRRKDLYVQNAGKLNGLQATVQFLTLSNDGIPQGNPRVKAIRNYE